MAVVLLVLGGYPAYVSGWAALHGSSHYYLTFFESNSWLLFNIAEASAVLALTLAFLHWRGWIFEDFRIRIKCGLSAHSLLLFLAAKIGNATTILGLLLVVYGFHLILHYLAIKNWSPVYDKPSPSTANFLFLIVFQIVNAFSEELIVIGYIFNQIASRFGPLVGLLSTVILRISWHTYQGPINMMGTGVVFIIFGIYYWKYRNLWPVILAHFLLDVLPINIIPLIASFLK